MPGTINWTWIIENLIGWPLAMLRKLWLRVTGQAETKGK